MCLPPARVLSPSSPPSPARLYPLPPSPGPSCFSLSAGHRGSAVLRPVFPRTCPLTPEGISRGSGCPGPELRHKSWTTQLSGEEGPVCGSLGWGMGKESGISSLFCISRLQAQRAGDSAAPPRASVVPAALCSPLQRGYPPLQKWEESREEDGQRLRSALWDQQQMYFPPHSLYDSE